MIVVLPKPARKCTPEATSRAWRGFSTPRGPRGRRTGWDRGIAHYGLPACSRGSTNTTSGATRRRELRAPVMPGEPHARARREWPGARTPSLRRLDGAASYDSGCELTPWISSPCLPPAWSRRPVAAALAGLRAHGPATSRTSTTTSHGGAGRRRQEDIDLVNRILGRNVASPSGHPRSRHHVQVENIRWTYVFYENGLSINVLYTLDGPTPKRAVGFKLSEGMDIPAELDSFQVRTPEVETGRDDPRFVLRDQRRLLTPRGTGSPGEGPTPISPTSPVADSLCGAGPDPGGIDRGGRPVQNRRMPATCRCAPRPGTIRPTCSAPSASVLGRVRRR